MKLCSTKDCGNNSYCKELCRRIRMNNLTVAETKDAVEAILVGRKKRQLINANRSV